MIYTGCITEIQSDDYDEIWWIVRSPQDALKKEKLVQSLAPSAELFRIYRNAFHGGEFGEEFFQNIYVPHFLKDLSQNEEALDDLRKLRRESTEKNIVLCCYCEDESLCHRSIIAGILLGMGAEIETKKDYLKYYDVYNDMVRNLKSCSHLQKLNSHCE